MINDTYNKKMEHRFSFRKRKYSTNIKKTKEQQEKELMGLPRNIGPYELIEKINDGGYSKIFLFDYGILTKRRFN